MRTKALFGVSKDTDKKLIIPFGSVIEIESTYQVQGFKTRKKLKTNFILHENLKQRKGVLAPYPENAGTEFLVFDRQNNTFDKHFVDPQSLEKDYDLSEQEYEVLLNFYVEENEGALVIKNEKFLEILDTYFFKKIRSIQHKCVVWRKSIIRIFLPYSNDNKYTNFGKIVTFYKEISLKAGDACLGEIKDSKKVYANPLALDIYLEGLGENGTTDKPTRLLISGTSFEERSSVFTNSSIDSLRDSILDGLPVRGNLNFIFVGKSRNYLKPAVSVNVEGITRSAGGDKKPDFEFEDVEFIF
jgi:hypothetical protein